MSLQPYYVADLIHGVMTCNRPYLSRGQQPLP